MPKLFVIILTVTFAGCAASSIQTSGQLTGPNQTYSLRVSQGDWLVAYATGDFDTVLKATMPAGQNLENDDYAGETNQSLIIGESAGSGTATLEVSGYDNARGRFEINAHALGGGSALLERDDNLTAEVGDSSDARFIDRFNISVVSGDYVMTQLSGSDFDMVMRARAPGDKDYEADDPEQIFFEAVDYGPVQIDVTSYNANETGRYNIATMIARDAQTVRELPLNLPTGQTQSVDYTVGEAGAYLVRVESSDFDTILKLRNNSTGEEIENDDYGEGYNSLAIIEAAAGVTLSIAVRPYDSSTGGAYTVTVLQARLLKPAAANVAGELSAGDERDVARYEKWYDLEVPGSGILIAELNAPDFDPMLRARVSNLGFENDDYMEDRHRSILAVPVRAAGKVRLGVTSYAERTTGSYRLEARFFPLANPPQIAPNWGSDG